MDPEVGSSLDDEYSVTRVVANVAWYNTCMICSRGGSCGNCFGGGKILMVGWVCRREFCGCVFGKGTLLGYFDEIFTGRVNGY